MENTIELPTLGTERMRSDSPNSMNPSVAASQPLQKTSVFADSEIKEDGKPSVIHSYCQQATERGYKECIWLCMERGRKWVAKDIQLDIEGSPLGIYELRKQFRWWKRYSFRSPVGVKEVQMRIVEVNKLSNEVEVVLMDFDYANRARELAQILDEEVEGSEPRECGIDIMGCSHPENILCTNKGHNEWMDSYCRVQYARELRLMKEEHEWLPAMLEFFWQHGITSKGSKFLKAANFITTYDGLQYERFLDATKPFGKTIYAFKVVEGWHLHYLLCFFAASILCSSCVVAIVTAATQNFDSGLTAGSYSLALAAVCLAILTFLSAVL